MMQSAVKNDFVMCAGHIPMQSRHYVYRLIRTDKNEPFYIGIGTHRKSYSFQRAKCAYGRGKLWCAIASKSEYRVEIIFESNDYDHIKKQEQFFISLYGRINTNTGPLVNLTDGGDGSINFKHTPESLKKMKGRVIKPISDETRRRMTEALLRRGHRSSNHPDSIPIYQYTLEGVFIKKWDCMMDIERELGVTSTQTYRVCKNGTHHSCGSYWFKEYRGEITDFISPKKVVTRKQVLAITPSGIILKEFKDLSDASISLFGDKSHTEQIGRSCRKPEGFHSGYYFKYKK